MNSSVNSEITLCDKDYMYRLYLSGGCCEDQNELLNDVCHTLNRSKELGITIEKLERLCLMGGDCVNELQ